jgi:hypothetical protein
MRSSLVRRLVGLLAAAPLLVLVACQNKPPEAPPTGPATPTVAGRPAPTFTDAVEARRAYTRSTADGTLLATLEDAAWIRLEGDAEKSLEDHRAYFDYGYTTFQVTLRSKAFTQPTSEAFLLEDSAGARLSGQPVSYRGSMTLVADRWQSTFSLSFRHTLTADTKWIRLTRQADGSALTWTFEGEPPAAAPPPVVPPPPPPPAGLPPPVVR